MTTRARWRPLLSWAGVAGLCAFAMVGALWAAWGWFVQQIQGPGMDEMDLPSHNDRLMMNTCPIGVAIAALAGVVLLGLGWKWLTREREDARPCP